MHYLEIILYVNFFSLEFVRIYILLVLMLFNYMYGCYPIIVIDEIFENLTLVILNILSE